MNAAAPMGQRMAALDRANEIRIRRAELKRRVKRDPPVLAAYVRRTPDWLEGAMVRDLMVAIPYLGCGSLGGKQAAINHVLHAAGCERLKTFGSLRRGQRERLAVEVDRLTARWSVGGAR